MAYERWRGVISAITTKLDPDQDVDPAAVAADVAFQLDSGVDAIICCGSLGEAGTLTAEEKLDVARAAKEGAAGRAPILLTIAEDSTRAACRLAEKAEAAGIDGLMVLPAMRYIADSREVLTHFRAVARASGLPSIIYNNPVAYTIDLTPQLLAELASEPRFTAIKESSADLRRITDIRNLLGDRYEILTGVDDLALESLVLGCTGWIAGLVCAFPEETVAIYRLVRAGRTAEALEIYRWFMPLLHLDFSTRFVQNIKLVEHLVRGTATTVRQPRLELVGAEREAVVAITEKALATRPDLSRYDVGLR
ncbi:MAG TPA: dihydrodipicolinate synthase family protein [Geminicoccaceae bacterium]|nr:dihydrodipicolinate synthase family protein [Geminicoccus sp.]HMU51049.1 dihydrodipicolinate synthase family protein [Geminicoccaceae bacterium]